MCSCHLTVCRHDPARRSRLVLRVGRAARRPGAARSTRSWSAAASCSPRATRPRRSASARRCRVGPPGGCVRTWSRSHRDSRPTPRRAGRCSRSSATRRRSSSRCRSTKRSSTSPGCGGSPGHPREIAAATAQRVADEVGLPITVGVARTKFLAKVASAVGKPDGLLVVEPDAELAFLHPLPVQRLWGVGEVTATKLHDRGVHTVADVAAMSPEALTAIVGRAMGHQLHALSHNRDARRVDDRQAARVDRIAAGARDPTSVPRRDRRRPVAPRRPDHRSDASRRTGGPHGHAPLPLRRLQPRNPIALAPRSDGRHRHRPRHGGRRPRRGVAARRGQGHHAARRVGRQPAAISTPCNSCSRSERCESEQLDDVMDAVRERFGRGALQRATTLRGDPGIQLPMLPD